MTTSTTCDVKTKLFCTNCKCTNHKVEPCHNKEEAIISVVEVMIHNNKSAKPLWFPYHVCGLMGHKMVECPHFTKTQKMFKNKNAKPKTSTTLEKKPFIILVNMVVVATKS